MQDYGAVGLAWLPISPDSLYYNDRTRVASIFCYNNIIIQSAFINVPSHIYSLMGIVNTTPDSFYDGGRYVAVDAAVEHGIQLHAEGAAVLDVGGASSRPGAKEVTPEVETERVLPVVSRLAGRVSCPISVDTTSAAVARAALDAGASWINDISAGRFDPGMASVVAAGGCTVVLMHSRATPDTMQQHADYGDDVVGVVTRELLSEVEKFLAAGVAPRRIVLDPGIGFAKTAGQSIALLSGLKTFVDLGYPVLIGTSRKSFIGKITGKSAPDERLAGTLGSVASAYLRGARIFRVHDVAATKDFLSVLCAIEQA
jgi:dihydropteroate synthase